MHPGCDQNQLEKFTFYTPEPLEQLRAEIPLDGLEVWYPTHGPELEAVYEAYAQRQGLLMSAGPDSHGPPGGLPIGYPAARWNCSPHGRALPISVSHSSPARTRTLPAWIAVTRSSP
ncbi:MAG: hypothetical protein IMW90_17680 [Thermogemmatispora sp.]|uniref:hypothetical protein n=1 Tax=Thermogemmatispora sp. TaxID=1968838 RepID=UPI0019F55DBE|nr:hypothetical protein [Thermogemmatispora sp.]MBE3567548.1 hypothetical protein [Thermogemmatispora sp.]